ncbi:MAG: phytoene/squalene synthase family protein [Phycisphaerales bacterium]
MSLLNSSRTIGAFEVPAAPATLTRSAVPAFPGVSAGQLAQGYEQCAGITRARARNFYYGLRLTPEPRRSAIYSIYAWMRGADDAADAQRSIESKRAELDLYRGHTRRILGGEIDPGLPAYWRGFAATVRTYPVDPRIFFDMLDGLDEDLQHDGYETDDELATYCYRVASTVGLVCISIWGLAPGADAERARDLAIRRGQAFQLTNILRDFAEDFDSLPSRVYLSRQGLGAAGVSAEQVRRWSDPVRCRAYLASQASAARVLYDASAGLEDLIDPACAPTLWAMTRIYSDILRLIEANPRCVVENKRVRLGSSRKARIALSASWRAKRKKWDL